MAGVLQKAKTEKKVLLIFVFLLFTSASRAQIFPDPESSNNPNHAMDRYHEELRFNEPMMYLAFPVISPLVKRTVPLRDGEGRDGYWVEGQFAHRFVAYQGKYYSYPLFQRLRLTFDVSILSRLTRDDSNPLLPSSNKFGFGLDFLLSSLKKLNEQRGGLVWTTLQLHHHSNGQADSFFLDTPVKRNNYKSGDFSANYWRAYLNISSNSANTNLIIGGIGYQSQIDFKGPLGSNNELKNYYGDDRWLFHLHWIKKPTIETVHTVNRGITNGDTVKREVRRQFSIRTELEYITGDLSLFPEENKYRLGWHNYLTYMPSVTNEIGFMLHTYMGRDYLNIRFDDIVFIGEAGLFFKFNSK
jgi:hypothetical protein